MISRSNEDISITTIHEGWTQTYIDSLGTLETLTHTNLIHHLDHFIQDSKLFVVTETLPSMTLKSFVNGHPQHETVIIKFIWHIANVLDFCQKSGVPHTTLNVFVRSNQFLLANFYKNFDPSIEDEIWCLGLLAAEMMLGHPLYSLYSAEFIRENPVPSLEANFSHDIILLTESMLFKVPAFRPSLSEILENPIFSFNIEKQLQEQTELAQEQTEPAQEQTKLTQEDHQNAERLKTNEQSNILFNLLSFFFVSFPSFFFLILTKLSAFDLYFFEKVGSMIMNLSDKAYHYYYPDLETISNRICNVFDRACGYFYHTFEEHLDGMCNRTVTSISSFCDQFVMFFSFLIDKFYCFFMYLSCVSLLRSHSSRNHYIFHCFVRLAKYISILTLKFVVQLSFLFFVVFCKLCNLFIFFLFSCTLRMVYAWSRSPLKVSWNVTISCMKKTLTLIQKIIFISYLIFKNVLRFFISTKNFIKITLKSFRFFLSIIWRIAYDIFTFLLILVKKIFRCFLFPILILSIIFRFIKRCLFSFVLFLVFCSLFSLFKHTLPSLMEYFMDF
jgi:hypothetical protein